jgi:hypothetical protein
MSDPQELDRELREYLEKEPNLRRDDRLKYLKTLFNKHQELSALDHIVPHKDLYEIFGGAKEKYTNQKLPAMISRKRLDGNELTHIAMIESFVSYLNKNHLLKKLVKFDYTE